MRISFGKYKDRPIELLLEDTSYCQWLVAQDWFASKNPELYDKIKQASQDNAQVLEASSLARRFSVCDLYPFAYTLSLPPMPLSIKLEKTGLVKRDYTHTETFKITHNFLNHYANIIENIVT